MQINIDLNRNAVKRKVPFKIQKLLFNPCLWSHTSTKCVWSKLIYLCMHTYKSRSNAKYQTTTGKHDSNDLISKFCLVNILK